MIDYVNLVDKINKTDDSRRLSSDEVKELNYEFSEGEVIEINTEITYKNKYFELVFYLNFPVNFPVNFPKIFLKKEIYDGIKYIPHVNKDYSICLFDEGLSPLEPKNLEVFIELLIAKSKKIIRASEDEGDTVLEFKREFRAYWEITYSEKDRVNNLGFHSIDSETESNVKALRFIKGDVSGYEYYLYTNEKDAEKIKNYCKSIGIYFVEASVLVIKNVFGRPPFEISNKESIDIIKGDDKYESFKAICNNNDFEDIVVVFFNNINDTLECYGWTYKGLTKIPRKKGGFRNNKTISYLTDPNFGARSVQRISFNNLSLSRLEIRTSGYVENQKSVTVSGLGSIGSNLIFFLKNLPIIQFNLIDIEALSVDNIKRHLLGFGSVSYSKTTGVEFELKKLNPLYNILTREESIATIIDKEPELINSCNLHIVAVGKSIIEKYILNKISIGLIKTPTIFFWVEPFLASGQMIYLNPNDADNLLKVIDEYPFDVLSKEQVNNDKTYLIEGSCQTGYFPYSSTYLIQFLSAVYPFLKDYVNTEVSPSMIYTWVGDKKLLEEKGLILSEFGKSHNTFEIVINKL
ncbi:E2/UBC family protein [Flavobacterium sp. ST-75]|uniref:E2/UBC family protein n=1 Tax=Flavobacterium rhizophilum TaxID=3163296 RepID=A0ABW8YCN5_9FLAO